VAFDSRLAPLARQRNPLTLSSYDPGFTVSVFDLVTPFAGALIAALVTSVTGTVVTANGAVVIPNGTVTVGVMGDALAGLLDDSVTTEDHRP
jgi:hypothetical protein